jgi:hypothetical protein
MTGAGLSNLEALKMSQLRQKKERLSYAVSRLELQAGQRERQLRKSMAFQWVRVEERLVVVLICFLYDTHNAMMMFTKPWRGFCGWKNKKDFFIGDADAVL